MTPVLAWTWWPRGMEASSSFCVAVSAALRKPKKPKSSPRLKNVVPCSRSYRYRSVRSHADE